MVHLASSYNGRSGENEPLIPARSVFILTTDSRVVPPASTSEIGLNNLANERYFERPEVIKAYKIQQDIQVPEFWQLEENVVGGRLRARTGETVCICCFYSHANDLNGSYSARNPTS